MGGALPGKQSLANLTLTLLVSLGALVGLYAVFRYAAGWGEGDTSAFTRMAYAMLQEGRLVPGQDAYPNGYGYQALVVLVVQLSGLPLARFQFPLALLLAGWVVLPAWLAYRELARSLLAGALATLFLLAQPEFLFPLLRGSHEKFTRGLMLLCLYLLLRALRAKNTSQAVGLSVTFYLAAFAMLAYNNLFASSFIAALALALALLWVVGWRVQGSAACLPQLRARLFYTVLGLLALAFFFMVYVYPPAASQLRLMGSIASRLATLFLQAGSPASPYQVVSAGWINPPAYFLLSLANWLLLGISLVVWLRQAQAWLVRRVRQPGASELLLWSCYAAFALQGALSVLVDLSGALAGNLQHRIFPSFAMLAAPLAASGLVGWVRRSQAGRERAQRLAALAMATLLLLAVLKATNEPLLSNKWLFYTPAERRALDWAAAALRQRALWSGFDERLAAGYAIHTGGQPLPFELDSSTPDPGTHDFLVSSTIALWAQRSNRQLPIPAGGLVVYDNGEVQIYHRRPRTEFQR